MAPVFKWPGGKRWILPVLSQHAGPLEGRWIEPFAGGAAAFFDLEPDQAWLNDINPALINAYEVIRDHTDHVVECLRGWENSESAYYSIRGLRPADRVTNAARFLYLTRLSFNGIYRENLNGEFNVPYGRKLHLDVCDENRLRSAARLLQKATLTMTSFEEPIQNARPGDIVYVDPPYANENPATFVKYNKNLFTVKDQQVLAGVCRSATERGVKVLVSNIDAEGVIDLFPEFSCMKLERFSRVSALPSGRRRITEVLLVSN